MCEVHAGSWQRTRLAPKFSRSISLIATIFSIGMQFANHTWESNVWNQQTEDSRSCDSIQRTVVSWVAASFCAEHTYLHCLAYASLGRMGFVLYVAAATHAQAHRGTCAFANYMYQFIVGNAYRVTVLRPAIQQVQPDQS